MYNLLLDILTAIDNIQFKSVVKNNTEYYIITDYLLQFTPKNCHIQLDNMFNGDKTLGW